MGKYGERLARSECRAASCRKAIMASSAAAEAKQAENFM